MNNNSNLANNYYFWRIKLMASHNYFKRQKKFNNVKLVNNWMKYKLDPVFENHLRKSQVEI